MKPLQLMLLSLLLASCAATPTSTTKSIPQPVVSGQQVTLAPERAAQTAQADAEQAGYSVLARFEHPISLFTQGLTYVGQNRVLESTGLVGQSRLALLDLSSGKILKSLPISLSGAFGEGSTVLRGQMYYLTWQDGVAIRYSAKTWKENKRFLYSGEGWGLTNDGKDLIMSDGTSRISFRSAGNFRVRKTINVTENGAPVTYLNELEYVGGYIYANVWQSSRILKIEARTGNVVGSYDIRALWDEAKAKAAELGVTLDINSVPNGIAYIPERQSFLLTGKNWPTLFEVSFK